MELFNFDESFIAPATITTRLDQQSMKGPDGLFGGMVSGTKVCRIFKSAQECQALKEGWNWLTK